MKPLSRAALNVHASTTMAIDSKAKQMKADGLDVIGFGAGEPDFHTPDNIKLAGIKAIIDNNTKYTPAAGIIPLRKAIAERLKLDCGLDYDYTQIVVASGAKHNVFLALAALVDIGDEVIIPAPFWLSYGEMVPMLGGVPVIVTTTHEQGFKITPEQLEAAVTEKTKVVIINNPSNPGGMFYSREELQALADVCVRHDLYILADEIYYKLLFDGREFVSVAALGEDIKERTIVVNGVSKCYCMTGWRLGYIAAPQEMIEPMNRLSFYMTAGATTFVQYAGVAALHEEDGSIERMRQEFKRRRDYLVEEINRLEHFSCKKPEGAFYIFMNIRKTGMTSVEFCSYAIDKYRLALIPGDAFGTNGEGYARLSYASSMEVLEKAIGILQEMDRAL